MVAYPRDRKDESFVLSAFQKMKIWTNVGIIPLLDPDEPALIISPFNSIVAWGSGTLTVAVDEWCSESGICGYTVEDVVDPEEQEGSFTLSLGYKITFKNHTDMLAFRMRWL